MLASANDCCLFSTLLNNNWSYISLLAPGGFYLKRRCITRNILVMQRRIFTTLLELQFQTESSEYDT